MVGNANFGLLEAVTIEEKEKWFRRVFNENRGRVFRVCYGILSHKEDVDDVFQEVMMNVWRHLEDFRGESQVSTWIYRITVNTAIQHRRHTYKSTKNFKSISDKEVSDQSIDDSMVLTDRKMWLEKLDECIASLRENDRIMITLLLEGCSYKHISEVIGISVNHVGVKMHRVKKQLASMLKIKGVL